MQWLEVGDVETGGRMLSAILEGLSIWLGVSLVVGHAVGALIHYEERLRLESLNRARL
jgi:hypothetical protein